MQNVRAAIFLLFLAVPAQAFAGEGIVHPEATGSAKESLGDFATGGGKEFKPPEADAPKPSEDKNASAETEKERRELWTGRLYTSTYRAGICINDWGALRGAVYLRQLGGAVDRYTVSGTVENGRVTARHGSGHVFQGYFVSENEAEGELTLKNGRKLRVRAARRQNAEVDGDCRLLQP